VFDENNRKALTVKVDMGKPIFESERIPVNCSGMECIDELLHLEYKDYRINCVSVGNPHCVILKDVLDEKEVKTFGHQIENHEIFPNRINVQFAKVVSDSEVEIMIWERGAGWTLASGSSSCAVASVMVKKGLTERNLSIKMPGGILQIEIDKNWEIRMTGEVREIATGVLSQELIHEIQE
jgi:diaminopimelate epimerase